MAKKRRVISGSCQSDLQVIPATDKNFSMNENSPKPLITALQVKKRPVAWQRLHIKIAGKKECIFFRTGKVPLAKGVGEAVRNDQDELVVMVNGRIEFTIGEDVFVAGCDTEVFFQQNCYTRSQIDSEDSIVYYGYKPTNS